MIHVVRLFSKNSELHHKRAYSFLLLFPLWRSFELNSPLIWAFSISRLCMCLPRARNFRQIVCEKWNERLALDETKKFEDFKVPIWRTLSEGSRSSTLCSSTAKAFCVVHQRECSMHAVWKNLRLELRSDLFWFDCFDSAIQGGLEICKVELLYWNY